MRSPMKTPLLVLAIAVALMGTGWLLFGGSPRMVPVLDRAATSSELADAKEALAGRGAVRVLDAHAPLQASSVSGLHGRVSHAADEGGGGGFTGGSGDGNHGAGHRIHENLRIVGERKASPAGFHQDGQFERDAARNADQVDLIKERKRVAAHDPFDRQLGQGLARPGEPLGGVLVIEGDVGSRAGEITRQGQPLTGCPNDQNACAGPIFIHQLHQCHRNAQKGEQQPVLHTSPRSHAPWVRSDSGAEPRLCFGI